MLKFREVSDLHLEFNYDYLLPKMEDDKNTVLALAGDICDIVRLHEYEYFFKDVSERFKNVLWVSGNHEYYKSRMNEADEKVRIFLQKYPNIEHTSNGKVFVLGDVTFIMATLWTDFNHPQSILHTSNQFSMEYCRRNMNDFWIIWDADGKQFTPEKSVELHKKQLGFIRASLQGLQTAKVVVITHHQPSVKSIHINFWKNISNPAFISDLSETIDEFTPDIWCAGHVHNSFDYMDNEKTRIIVNPKGYPGENSGFNPNLLIEL